jgi:gentisate 1,2-dioxygenase
MATFQDVEIKLVDSIGRQTPETKAWGDHNLPMWAPVKVAKADIEREIERLASIARPANGVRRVHFVHPRCIDGSKAFAPGVDVSLNVLLPGERTAPVRQNSSVVDFCIKGAGAVIANGRINRFAKYDLVTTPSMAVHEYVTRATCRCGCATRMARCWRSSTSTTSTRSRRCTAGAATT